MNNRGKPLLLGDLPLWWRRQTEDGFKTTGSTDYRASWGGKKRGTGEPGNRETGMENNKVGQTLTWGARLPLRGGDK